jgi:hypothetical protein
LVRRLQISHQTVSSAGVLEPVVAFSPAVELPQGAVSPVEALPLRLGLVLSQLLVLELQRQPRQPVEQLRQLAVFRLA